MPRMTYGERADRFDADLAAAVAADASDRQLIALLGDYGMMTLAAEGDDRGWNPIFAGCTQPVAWWA